MHLPPPPSNLNFKLLMLQFRMALTSLSEFQQESCRLSSFYQLPRHYFNAMSHVGFYPNRTSVIS